MSFDLRAIAPTMSARAEDVRHDSGVVMDSRHAVHSGSRVHGFLRRTGRTRQNTSILERGTPLREESAGTRTIVAARQVGGQASQIFGPIDVVPSSSGAKIDPGFARAFTRDVGDL